MGVPKQTSYEWLSLSDAQSSKYMIVMEIKLNGFEQTGLHWCIKTFWKTIYTHVTKNRGCNDQSVHPTRFKNKRKRRFYEFPMQNHREDLWGNN